MQDGSIYYWMDMCVCEFFFFFNDTATTEIYTLSLHDALPILNLMLHGVDDPDIHYQDTLSSGFTNRFPNAATEGFDIVLANPPFKGSLDFEDVHASLLRQVKTKKTELLFVALILRMLKTGGRSATIVPDGVLFGSSGAHRALRKLLVDNNQLEAVISLPSGVFKPYAGVSTGILAFAKGEIGRAHV